MNARRSFLKNLGLFGVMVGGASAAGATANVASKGAGSVLPVDGMPFHSAVVESGERMVEEDISHLAPPDGATTLQINGSYGPPPEAKPNPLAHGSGQYYTFAPINRQVTNSVTMTVGKDDRLWMKVGDKWRRVALEG